MRVEDQLETRGVVGGVGVEGVIRGGQQVDFVAREVVPEIQIGEVQVLEVKMKGVGTVFGGFESEGLIIHAVDAEDGQVLVVLVEVDLRRIFVIDIFQQVVAIVEAEEGLV